MDAFTAAVDDARRKLIRMEGNDVSVRELIRRAGFTTSQRPGVAYHLNGNRHTGRRPHRIPAAVITRLAAVLPVDGQDLTRAAAKASGLNLGTNTVNRIDGAGQVTLVVSRFLADETVTEGEKQAATAGILQIIASQPDPTSL